jgi:hypothetical protein
MSNIFYVYDKTTGEYAGSGITEIDNDTHGSTLKPPPEQPDDEQPVAVRKPDDSWELVTKADVAERIEAVARKR